MQYELLDVCHMLRFVRNTQADGGILQDKDWDKIIWQYLVELHKLQTAEGLRLGNKFKKAKGFTSALHGNNKRAWQPFLKQTSDYILDVTDATGNKMVSSQRKTSFVGFLVAIKSVEGIIHEQVEPENSALKYLLTYKLGQDHLELLFAAIRPYGGFKNFPTARQFTAAYKHLLLHSSAQMAKAIVSSKTQLAFYMLWKIPTI